MSKSILKEGKNYTFSDYFLLNYSTKDILKEFGYQYTFEKLVLPEIKERHFSLDRLQETYLKKLPLISLNSEAAKREFYLSPLFLELLEYIKAEINVEYPLNVEDNLNGMVDYLLKADNNLIVVEAKKGDLERGFNQLAVELIALDKYLENTSAFLYGAITLGDIWRFGVLERDKKLLSKDMDAYTLPSDLEKLFAILLGILS